ncbi:carbohydrate-binding module family 18 [Xylaria longipes]|nr:carbohydrate-binding module family 18 [Xylaria longipes]
MRYRGLRGSISPHVLDFPFSAQDLPDGKCSATEPCVKDACCNKLTGNCGYGPAFCADDVCSSKCDSKSECGEGAEDPSIPCPLNVCCSKYGFCGTTEEFCGPNYTQPGPQNQSPGNVQDLVIGYFEAWSLLRRGCGGRTIESIPVDSLTHINVAFGYMEPETFRIYNIEGSSINDFKQITSLKQRAPGLKVWVSLGGWTYSDNDTDTQPVWSDISATPGSRAKFIGELMKFMTQWGFDGVDLDWEYPAAPDRRGKPEDVANFVLLVKDIQDYFSEQKRGWGLSFTAPTSYYYLRWFDIENLVKYVDWMNFLTYDIHGSWDNQSDWIGPHVYAHTNLTEIEEGLNLLWRNNVPANKVNLGLGFYGRSYTLKDPDCGEPGCPFTGPGVAGACSGTAGYMSYQISYQLTKGGDEHKDEEAAVMYYQFDTDQWISYDNEDTLREKVNFANNLGLRGLFIWAIDQDTLNSTLLDAVLQPEGLGKFGKHNGVGNDGQDWISGSMIGCDWSECGGSCLGKIAVTQVRCSDTPDGDKPYKQLCCPPDNAPDPKFCRWYADHFLGFCTSDARCRSDEVLVASDNHFVDEEGDDQACLFGIGQASYCCEADETQDAVCRWNEGHYWEKEPKEGDGSCPDGTTLVTYRATYQNLFSDISWQTFCCSKGVSPSACHWVGNQGNRCIDTCKGGELDLGVHLDGGGAGCYTTYMNGFNIIMQDTPTRLCCDKDALTTSTQIKKLPIPLEYLFDEAIPDTDEQSWDIRTDPNSPSDDPNKASFGWHIMSGPEDQLTSLNKRDGTHWEVFDCDPVKHQGLQTAKMFCAHAEEDKTEGISSNCGTILKGGVAGTVIEMPSGCGSGKYAMAVALQPLEGMGLEDAATEHIKRNLTDRTVYQLTFDYDFSILQGREDNHVKLRTDYSDDPGYWETVVAAPVKARGIRLGRREMHDEVAAQHGGSWAAYAEHHWQLDKRSTPTERYHELHERWFSITIQDWLDRQGEVTYGANLISHAIRENFRWTIFNDRKSCPNLEAYVHLYADFWVNIDTSATLTIIFDLSNIAEPRESHVMFRNKGEVKTALVFEALADFRFTTGQTQIAGFAPVGASFSIPGIVTIGPEFKLVAELSARAVLHTDARIDLDVASWDYTQRYPFEGNDNYLDTPKKMDGNDEVGSSSGHGPGKPVFFYDIGVEGSVTAHVIPTMTFGITFNPSYTVPNAAIELGVDSWARVYGSSASSSDVAYQYCYGAKMGYEVFARLDAPNLFRAVGVDLSNRWTIYKPDEIDIIEEVCQQAEAMAARDLLAGYDMLSMSSI